jgi:hypothetical protein
MDSFSLVTQPDAQRVCRQDGANLAIAYGVNGRFFILDEYRWGMNSIMTWIDGTDFELDRIWIFRDGEASPE